MRENLHSVEDASEESKSRREASTRHKQLTDDPASQFHRLMLPQRLLVGLELVTDLVLRICGVKLAHGEGLVQRMILKKRHLFRERSSVVRANFDLLHAVSLCYYSRLLSVRRP